VAATGGLVGRRVELASLRSAVDALGDGQGCALALVGEPGIGKTRLATAAAEHARDRGVPVLGGSGTEFDPCAPLLSVYRAATLLSPARSAGGHVAELAGWRAVPELVAEAAGDGGVVVGLDDLHWTHPDLAEPVEELVRLAAAAPLLLVLAYRERQLSRRLAATVSRPAAAGLLRIIRVGPLSREESGALVGDRPDVEQLYRESGGNPLYLQVLAAGAGEVPSQLRLPLRGEMAALNERQTLVAHAAAVLGERFHPEQVAAVAGLGQAQTLAALDALARRDIIRAPASGPLLCFRHPVVPRVVQEGIEPGRRLAMHRRAAAELARQGAPLRTRAHHVAQAARPASPEDLDTLLAASYSIVHEEPATAAGWLETALELAVGSDERRFEVQVLLARAQLLAGRLRDSRDVLHTALAHRPGGNGLGTAAVVACGQAERMLGRYTEAAALLRGELAALPHKQHASAAALHAELAEIALDVDDQAAAARHAGLAARLGQARADRAADRTVEAGALAQAALAHVRAADVAAAERASSAAAELVDGMSDAAAVNGLTCLHQLGLAELHVERLADAQRHLDRAEALCRRTGQAHVLAQVLKDESQVLLRTGRLGRAAEVAEEAQYLARRAGNLAVEAFAGAFRSHALLWLRGRADVQEAQLVAERAAASVERLPWGWATVVRCMYGEIMLHAREPRHCERLLWAAGEGEALPAIWPGDKPRLWETLTVCALVQDDAAAAMERASLAARSAARVPLSGRRGYAARARMLALAATGGLDGATAAAADSVDQFSRQGMRLEACRTLVSAAQRHAAAGRRGDSLHLLDRAHDLIQECGSRRLAQIAEAQRRKLAADAVHDETVLADGAGALAALSVREREVARLACMGKSSREIAGELFLSVRTVDSHLGRIYRKLGVPNRAVLTRVVLETVRGRP